MVAPSYDGLALVALAMLSSACGEGAQSAPDEPHDGGAGGSQAGSTSGAFDTGAKAGQSGLSGGGGGSAGDDSNAAGSGSPPAALEPYQIAATTNGTCALAADQTIRCWGLTSSGAWTIPEGTFTELHGGTDAIICAVRLDRSVACFAEPLGIHDLTRQPSGAVKLLAVGDGAVCGTDSDDVAFCNPSNELYELSPPAEEVSALSVGAQFVCWVGLAEGNVSCTGAATFGNCTFSFDFGQLEPPAGTYVQISSGSYNSCALDVAGKLACWGIGKTGDAQGADCYGERSAGQSEPPEGTFRLVRAAELHACAIRSDGTVACWGKGSTGDCGDGACNRSRPPAGVVFEQLALGLNHSCGMKSDRTIQCWGFGGDGATTPPAEFQ